MHQYTAPYFFQYAMRNFNVMHFYPKLKEKKPTKIQREFFPFYCWVKLI